MKNKVLIIGAGQLGSRHLQALAKLSGNYELTVVDPSIESLKIAQERYIDVMSVTSPKVTYAESLFDVDSLEFEVVIVASGASVRLGIVKELISRFQIRYLILEKVLFQSANQLKQAMQMLEEANIKTWVNCPRRQFTAYKEIKARSLDCESISVSVHGSNWGLACNAIHFIDLWHYLSDFTSYTITYEPNIEVIDSKRLGYKELLGTLNAKSEDGRHRLSLTCVNNEQLTFDIEIESERYKIKVSEQSGEVKWLDENQHTLEITPLKVLFQSQLTHTVVTDLVDKGDCELTKLESSGVLHAEFLTKTLQVFKDNNADNNGLVPIT